MCARGRGKRASLSLSEIRYAWLERALTPSSSGPTRRGSGHPHADPADAMCESAVERHAHSRRTAQIGVADVATLVSKQPRVRIQLLCDGAPEMWRLLDDGFTREKFGDRLHELVDLYHLMEKLAPAAHLLDGDSVAKTLGAWKLALLNRPQAATRIRMELELSGKEH